MSGLEYPQSVVVSPDGKNVYVASGGVLTTATVDVFDRAADGALTAAGCVDGDGGGPCGAGNRIPGLLGPTSVAVSPNGANVYVSSYTDDAVITLDRGAGGSLTAAGAAGCVEDTSSTACSGATQTPGLMHPSSVAVSADGESVYVATSESDAVVRFNRGANGLLTPAGCFDDTSQSACGNEIPGLVSADTIAVSPDGANVYVGSGTSNAVDVFNRAEGGVLTSAGCFENTGGSLCGTGRQTPALGTPNSLAVSPDGASVYVAAEASNALVSFTREVAPTCAAVTSKAPAGRSTAIQLSCSDLNLDPLTLSVTHSPAHGTLGSIGEGGAAGYTPAVGYVGADSFTYTASDGSLTSTSATVTITVTSPPRISITSPGSGAVYVAGAAVKARYSCSPAAGTSLTSCSDSAAARSTVDSSTPGAHTFIVTATGSDGGRYTRTVDYRVVARLAVRGVRQSHRIWREQRGGRRHPPTGTTFSLTLNQPGSVRLVFTQTVAGRRVTRGTLRFSVRQGTNNLAFRGRITRSKILKPGRYALVITVTSAGGQRWSSKNLSFAILR